MSHEIPNEVLDAILQQLTQGNKIAAVKLYKDHTQFSLADSKAAIDALSAQLHIRSNTESSSTPTNEELEQLLLANQKIEAIKRYRSQFSTSLVDAKHAVEAIEDRLRLQYPDRFTSLSRGGCMSIVVLAMITGGLVVSVIG